MTKPRLSFKTLPPELSSHDEPQIYAGRSADVEEAYTNRITRLLIENIWKHKSDCILDMRITNLDAPSNIHWKPEAVHERKKKKQYLQGCVDQRSHFSPFVVSCDGVLENDAKVVLQHLAESLA